MCLPPRANLAILGKSSVGKSHLAQALVNTACRSDYTARYFRLEDLANKLALYHRSEPERWSSYNARMTAMPFSG